MTVGNVNGQFATTTSPTGSDGKYSVVLYNVPTTGRWYVVVVDSSGKELSARVQVETSTANCGPGQSGIQIARVDFRKDY
ncbi:MAG: hypothetical protein HYX94_10690 [Chloroflexi bacterium]|nr:hypothetical protein [Chloroflexota bacterium]